MSTWNEQKKTRQINKSRGSRRVSGFHVRLSRGIEVKDLNCVLFSEEIVNMDSVIKVVHAFNEIHIVGCKYHFNLFNVSNIETRNLRSYTYIEFY